MPKSHSKFRTGGRMSDARTLRACGFEPYIPEGVSDSVQADGKRPHSRHTDEERFVLSGASPRSGEGELVQADAVGSGNSTA